MLKRGARGHDLTGAQGTCIGQCAVRCPACPHKFTLSEGWENAPKEKKYVFLSLICGKG